MRNLIVSIVLVAITVSSVGFAAEGKKETPKALPATQTKSAQTADEKAVRASAAEFINAFNTGDAKGLGALWSPNCEYVDENGRMFRGREAVEKEYGAFFKANPGLKIDVAISSIKTIGNQAAIEEGTAIVTNADGATLSRGSYTAIHEKQGDKWLIASVRERAAPSPAKRPTLEDLDWLVGEWIASEGSKSLRLSFKWIAEKKFLELAYSARDKDNVARSGIQIVGRDPLSGDVISWSFDSTGGHGQGHWKLLKKGLIIESRGMMPDGAPTYATEIVSKTGADSFTWKSVNRSVAGHVMPDEDAVVMKRKPK